jgi:glyoxylase-like metal-dependent hydrolase (beta-lactamase superfamily II)
VISIVCWPSPRSVRITHVLETHIHNDYVTGGLELATVTGAEYVVPGGEDVSYPRRPIADGDIVDADGVPRILPTVGVMHTNSQNPCMTPTLGPHLILVALSPTPE